MLHFVREWNSGFVILKNDSQQTTSFILTWTHKLHLGEQLSAQHPGYRGACRARYPPGAIVIVHISPPEDPTEDVGILLHDSHDAFFDEIQGVQCQGRSNLNSNNA